MNNQVTYDVKQCFEYFQLKEGATVQELRKSYYKLSLKVHPDKNPNIPEEHFKGLVNCYEWFKNYLENSKNNIPVIIPENAPENVPEPEPEPEPEYNYEKIPEKHRNDFVKLQGISSVFLERGIVTMEILQDIFYTSYFSYELSKKIITEMFDERLEEHCEKFGLNTKKRLREDWEETDEPTSKKKK